MPLDMLSAANEVSLALRVLEIARRRRTIAVVVFTAVLASAVSFARYLPDLFRATATVLVERPVLESSVRSTLRVELESRLHVIKQEILSRDRLTELIVRFNLYPELRDRAPFEAVLDQMRRDIQIELLGSEQLSGRATTVAFRLSYTGTSRETVADVTNAIAAFYVAQNDQMRSDEAARTTEFLKTQLETIRHGLDREEARVRAYMTSHAGELPQLVEFNLATLERLNTQLRLNSEQQIRTLEQRERLLAQSTATATGAPDDLAAPESAAERLERMKGNLQRLEIQFASKHPDVVRLREEIAVLEREMAQAEVAPETPAAAPGAPSAATPKRSRTLDALDAELEKLKNEEASLRQNIATLERRLETVPERQQEFSQISRDYETTKEQYALLLKRYDEAQLAESVEVDRQGERFRILEPALPPATPSAPNRLRLMIVGLLLAAAAAFGVVIAAEQFDTSFHTVDEIREFTKVPVLVTIPRIAPWRVARFVRAAFATASVLAALALIAVLSAHLASGNHQLVRMLARGA